MTTFTARDVSLGDMARDLAAIDEQWLCDASPRVLKMVLREFRDQARTIIERHTRSCFSPPAAK